MGNRATENRDIHLARHMEEGRIRTWADGFGVWHAAVSPSFATPLQTARYAIRLQLQHRAPRDTYVDPPQVTHEGTTDDGFHHYKEA